MKKVGLGLKPDPPLRFGPSAQLHRCKEYKTTVHQKERPFEGRVTRGRFSKRKLCSGTGKA
jgi:hypothetical protein